MSEDGTNVAIACQGGGSHTAFTAGVLKGLLPELDGYNLVGLSGTSGGAFSALAAWYGLLTGGEERAEELLEDIWVDLAAHQPTDRAVNDWLVWGAYLEHMGFPIPGISPHHNPAADWGQQHLRSILERYVDFDRIPDLVGPETPKFAVGTVNVNAGKFETFSDEAITADAILASTAVPELFESVTLHGHDHWDGLFSQNPPIHELFLTDTERKPEELWVVQINPQTRADTPTALVDILDRRNELAGNLSLNQELRFIETVNKWVDKGHLPSDEYRHTTVRRIELQRDLGVSSKLDRRPRFIESLIEDGERKATEFLADL
jgi:NTE family protein